MSGSEDEKGSLVAKPEDPDKVARAKELAQEPDESDAIFKVSSNNLYGQRSESGCKRQLNIFQVIRRFLFKSMAWVGIYFLGYYDFSIAWLFTPLLLTVSLNSIRSLSKMCISRFLTQFSMQPPILGLAQGSMAAR